MVTKDGKIRERASEWVRFRVTPRQLLLAKKMAEDLEKRGCCHNLTDAWLFLLENWHIVAQARRFLDLQGQAEKARLQAGEIAADLPQAGCLIALDRE